MFMVAEHYSLKRSQIAVVFQLSLLLLISIALYQAITFLLWCLANILMIGAWIHFIQQPQLKAFAILDQRQWSFEFEQQKNIDRVIVTKFVDHYFYIAIYLSNHQRKNVIIWKDQLSLNEWKKLRSRAKMN